MCQGILKTTARAVGRKAPTRYSLLFTPFSVSMGRNADGAGETYVYGGWVEDVCVTSPLESTGMAVDVGARRLVRVESEIDGWVDGRTAVAVASSPDRSRGVVPGRTGALLGACAVVAMGEMASANANASNSQLWVMPTTDGGAYRLEEATEHVLIMDGLADTIGIKARKPAKRQLYQPNQRSMSKRARRSGKGNRVIGGW